MSLYGFERCSEETFELLEERLEVLNIKRKENQYENGLIELEGNPEIPNRNTTITIIYNQKSEDLQLKLVTYPGKITHENNNLVYTLVTIIKRLTRSKRVISGAYSEYNL